MRLSAYAKQNGITYGTAYKYWQKGIIKGKQLPTGTIFIENTESEKFIKKVIGNSVVLYARVSSSENKDNLESQLQRLKDFASAKGYTVIKEVKEIGSGINSNRRKLLSVLKQNDYNIILVEHKDRFARFGIEIIEELLSQQGKTLEVINQAETEKENLVQDLISIITSYSAKIYGQRRSRRKTEKLIHMLQQKNGKNKKKRDNIEQNDKQEKIEKVE